MSEYLPIRVDIKTAAEAHDLIMERSRQDLLLEIDWSKYGSFDKEALKHLLAWAPDMILRNTQYDLPLNIVTLGWSPEDDKIYESAPNEFSFEISEISKLVLFRTLTPEEATLVRDLIFTVFVGNVTNFGFVKWEKDLNQVIEDVFKNDKFKNAFLNTDRNLYRTNTPLFSPKLII